jgi:uncharacterized NAD(P)/FAD-binding protein YdhS
VKRRRDKKKLLLGPFGNGPFFRARSARELRAQVARLAASVAGWPVHRHRAATYQVDRESLWPPDGGAGEFDPEFR